MLTTTQVRAAMIELGLKGPKWTNKTSGHTGLDRRVKVSVNCDHPMSAAVKELRRRAGAKNVKVVRSWWRDNSIIVKCVLDVK